MKRIFLTSILVLIAITAANAQDEFRQKYENFQNRAVISYSDFRKECNTKYAEFLKFVWEKYTASSPISKPEEKEVPPVMIDGKNEPIIENQKLDIVEIIQIPSPGPRPEPVSPILERPVKPTDGEPVKTETRHVFDFFGTEIGIRVHESQKFTIKSPDGNAVASAWERLSSEEYDNMLIDCLKARDEYKLCDWAYLEMLFAFSDSYLGRGNSSTLLAAYIFSQSGYKMRLGASQRGLELLYCSDYQIYGVPFYKLGGGHFYQYNGSDTELEIVDFQFPNEKPISLSINELPELAYAPSELRIFSSDATGEIESASVNRNLVDFYSSYPSSQINDNPVTRWALYADAPLDSRIKARLYPQLMKSIDGKSNAESVGILLHFIQMAFAYEYDEKVWGTDRAFFAEETLFYPYCDCEDRAILFSRLVRDLLGLDVLLVYYPGHLATAVNIPERVEGDYISLNSGRYIVCDPTYIGAPIGLTMPNMDNKKAKVILLN